MRFDELAEIRLILFDYARKAGAFEVNVGLPIDITIENLAKDLHRLVDEIAEDGRKELRRRWVSPSRRMRRSLTTCWRDPIRQP